MVRGTKSGWTRSGKFDGANQKRDVARKLRRLHLALDENPHLIGVLEEHIVLKAEATRLQAGLLAASQGKKPVVQIYLLKTEVARLQKELNAALCRNFGYEAQLQVKVKLEKKN